MNKLKSIVLLALSLLMLWSCSKDNNGKTEEPKPVNVRCVTINGQNLVQPDGSKLFIKGVNLAHWLNQEGYMFNFQKRSAHQINEMFCQLVGPEYTAKFWKDFIDNYITLEDMEFIKSTGANTVRLPLHYKLFTNEDFMGSNDPDLGFEILDRVIEWCKQTGLYVVVDLHCAPGGNSGDNIDDSHGYPWLFESDAQQRKTCELWKKIADRCKGEAIVLGYELLNEPIPSTFKHLYPQLHPVLKRITQAIREVDQNHIVIWGGANYNDDFTVFDVNDLAFDNKIMFACHRYGSQWIGNFTEFRDKVNLPMFMSEWGHGESWEWQSTFSKVLRDNNIGYTSWPYKKISGWDSFVGVRQPDNWDKIVEFEKSPRMNYDDIVAAREKCGQDVARKAMADFIENCKYKNCEKFEGYINSVRMNE